VVRGVEICPVVAPGQSLVLYNKDVVCGGGIIISSEEVSPCQ
jgi:tRNA-specific 2-thiouridylase